MGSQELKSFSRRGEESKAPFNVSLRGYIPGLRVQVESSLGLYKVMGIHRAPV
jgi:hypothetical protein